MTCFSSNERVSTTFMYDTCSEYISKSIDPVGLNFTLLHAPLTCGFCLDPSFASFSELLISLYI